MAASFLVLCISRNLPVADFVGAIRLYFPKKIVPIATYRVSVV